ncbi:unnamed protein product [Symbiodinium sp. CCMP2592]|nr:unnamed protein product [Symbiodinium sp. CCMP2592]
MTVLARYLPILPLLLLGLGLLWLGHDNGAETPTQSRLASASKAGKAQGQEGREKRALFSGGAGSQSSQKGGPGKGKEKADNPQVTKIEFGLPPSMVQSLQSIATRATQDLWSQTAFTAENATVEQLAQRSANALGRLSRRLNGNVRAKKDLQDALLAWLSTMGQHLLGLAHRVDALSRKVDEDTVAAVEEMRQVMAAQPSVTTEEQLDRAIQSLGPVWSEGQVLEVQRLAAALRAFSTTLAMPSGTHGPAPGLANVHRGGPFLGMQAAAGPSSDVPMFPGPQQPAGDHAADHSSEMSFGPLGNTSSQALSGMDGQRSGRRRKRSGGNVDRPSKSPRRDLEGAPWPGEATGRTPEGLKRDAQTAVADDDPELLPATATESAWVVSWLALLRFAVDSGADLVGEVSCCPQQDKAMQLTLDAQAQDVVLRTAESVWTALGNAVADPAHADLQSLFLSLQGFLHSVRGCANALPQVRQGLLVAALLSNGNLRDPFAYAPSTAQEWLFPDLLLEAGVPLRGFVAKASWTGHLPERTRVTFDVVEQHRLSGRLPEAMWPYLGAQTLAALLFICSGLDLGLPVPYVLLMGLHVALLLLYFSVADGATLNLGAAVVSSCFMHSPEAVQLHAHGFHEGLPVLSTGPVLPTPTVEEMCEVYPVGRTGNLLLPRTDRNRRHLSVFVGTPPGAPILEPCPIPLLVDEWLHGPLLHARLAASLGFPSGVFSASAVRGVLPGLPGEQILLTPAACSWRQVWLPVDLRQIGGRICMLQCPRDSTCRAIAQLALSAQSLQTEVDLLLARCPWGWLTLVSQPLFLQDVDTLQFQLGPSTGALEGPIGASLDPPLSLFSTMQVSLPSAPLNQEAFPGHSHNQAILITPNGLVYVEAPVFADAATFRRIVSTRASASATGGIMRIWHPLPSLPLVQFLEIHCVGDEDSSSSSEEQVGGWDGPDASDTISASWLQVGDFGDGSSTLTVLFDVGVEIVCVELPLDYSAEQVLAAAQGEGVLSFEVPHAAEVDSALLHALLRQVLPGKHIFIEIPDTGALPHATFAAVSSGQDCIIYRLTDASVPTAPGLFLAFSGVFDSFSAFLESLLSSGRPAAGLLRSLRTFGLSVLTWERATIPTRDDCHFWYVHVQADFARARRHAVHFFGHPRAIRQPSVLPPPRARAVTHVGVQTNAPFITASTQAAVLQSPPSSCGAGVVPDSASELVSLWCDSWHIKCIIACIPGFTVWALREGGRLVGMCTPVPTWEAVTRALSLSLWELPQTFLSDNNQVWPYPRDLADVTRKCVSVGYDSPEGVSQLLRHCTAPSPSPPPSPPASHSAALGLACLSKGKPWLGFLLFAMQAGSVQLAITSTALTSRVGADDPLLPRRDYTRTCTLSWTHELGRQTYGFAVAAPQLGAYVECTSPWSEVQIHLWLPGQGPVHMRVGARHMDMHLSAYLGAFLPDCEYGLHVAYDSNPQVLDLVVAPPSPVAWWILRDSIGCELLRPVIQHYTSHCSFFFCTVEPDGVVLSVEPSAEVRQMSPSPQGARALISRALPGLIGQVIDGTLLIAAAKAGPLVLGHLAMLLLTFHAAAMQPPQAHQLVPVAEVAPSPSTMRIWTLNVPQPVDLPWRPQGYQTRWLRELMCRLHHIPDPGEFRSTHSQQGGTVQHVLFVPVVPPTLPTARFWLLHWGAAAVVTFGHSPFNWEVVYAHLRTLFQGGQLPERCPTLAYAGQFYAPGTVLPDFPSGAIIQILVGALERLPGDDDPWNPEPFVVESPYFRHIPSRGPALEPAIVLDGHGNRLAAGALQSPLVDQGVQTDFSGNGTGLDHATVSRVHHLSQELSFHTARLWAGLAEPDAEPAGDNPPVLRLSSQSACAADTSTTDLLDLSDAAGSQAVCRLPWAALLLLGVQVPRALGAVGSLLVLATLNSGSIITPPQASSEEEQVNDTAPPAVQATNMSAADWAPAPVVRPAGPPPPEPVNAPFQPHMMFLRAARPLEDYALRQWPSTVDREPAADEDTVRRVQADLQGLRCGIRTLAAAIPLGTPFCIHNPFTARQQCELVEYSAGPEINPFVLFAGHARGRGWAGLVLLQPQPDARAVYLIGCPQAAGNVAVGVAIEHRLIPCCLPATVDIAALRALRLDGTEYDLRPPEAKLAGILLLLVERFFAAALALPGLLLPFYPAWSRVCTDLEETPHSQVWAQFRNDDPGWAEDFFPVWPGPAFNELSIVPIGRDPALVTLMLIWRGHHRATLVPRTMTVDWITSFTARHINSAVGGVSLPHGLAVCELFDVPPAAFRFRNGDVVYVHDPPDDPDEPLELVEPWHLQDGLAAHHAPWAVGFQLMFPISVHLLRPGKPPLLTTIPAGESWCPEAFSFSGEFQHHFPGMWTPVQWTSARALQLIEVNGVAARVNVVAATPEGRLCRTVDRIASRHSVADQLHFCPDSIQVGGVPAYALDQACELRNGDVVFGAFDRSACPRSPGSPSWWLGVTLTTLHLSQQRQTCLPLLVGYTLSFHAGLSDPYAITPFHAPHTAAALSCQSLIGGSSCSADEDPPWSGMALGCASSAMGGPQSWWRGSLCCPILPGVSAALLFSGLRGIALLAASACIPASQAMLQQASASSATVPAAAAPRVTVTVANPFAPWNRVEADPRNLFDDVVADAHHTLASWHQGFAATGLVLDSTQVVVPLPGRRLVCLLVQGMGQLLCVVLPAFMTPRDLTQAIQMRLGKRVSVSLLPGLAATVRASRPVLALRSGDIIAISPLQLDPLAGPRNPPVFLTWGAAHAAAAWHSDFLVAQASCVLLWSPGRPTRVALLRHQARWIAAAATVHHHEQELGTHRWAPCHGHLGAPPWLVEQSEVAGRANIIQSCDSTRCIEVERDAHDLHISGYTVRPASSHACRTATVRDGDWWVHSAAAGLLGRHLSFPAQLAWLLYSLAAHAWAGSSSCPSVDSSEARTIRTRRRPSRSRSPGSQWPGRFFPPRVDFNDGEPYVPQSGWQPDAPDGPLARCFPGPRPQTARVLCPLRGWSELLFINLAGTWREVEHEGARHCGLWSRRFFPVRAVLPVSQLTLAPVAPYGLATVVFHMESCSAVALASVDSSLVDLQRLAARVFTHARYWRVVAPPVLRAANPHTHLRLRNGDAFSLVPEQSQPEATRFPLLQYPSLERARQVASWSLPFRFDSGGLVVLWYSNRRHGHYIRIRDTGYWDPEGPTFWSLNGEALSGSWVPVLTGDLSSLHLVHQASVGEAHVLFLLPPDLMPQGRRLAGCNAYRAPPGWRLLPALQYVRADSPLRDGDVLVIDPDASMVWDPFGPLPSAAVEESHSDWPSCS